VCLTFDFFDADLTDFFFFLVPPAVLLGSFPIIMITSPFSTPIMAGSSSSPLIPAFMTFWKYFWACVRVCTTVRVRT
jgi:hypothetical protein